MMTEQIDLTHEVEALHRQFFHREASAELVEGYRRAHAELQDLARASNRELHTVRVVLERRLDALGIEPWLRSGPERHLLSRKLLLIAYLAECDAAHLEFRQEVRGRVQAFMHLGWSGIFAALHLLRGRLQKAWYGLL